MTFNLAILEYDRGTGKKAIKGRWAGCANIRDAVPLDNEGKGIPEMSMGDDENDVNNTEHNDWPQTVDEAVDRLLAGLSDKDKETVRST